MAFISKFHPLLVHFPIALVLAAAGAECVVIATTRTAWRTVAVANIRAAAAMGVVTAITGWLFASSPLVDLGPSLEWHRWLGMAGAAGAIGAALLSSRLHGASRRSAFVVPLHVVRHRAPRGDHRLIWAGRSCGEPDSFDRSQRCRIDQRRVPVKNKNDETEWDRRRFLTVHGVGRHRRGLDDDERHPQRHAD